MVIVYGVGDVVVGYGYLGFCFVWYVVLGVGNYDEDDGFSCYGRLNSFRVRLGGVCGSVCFCW